MDRWPDRPGLFAFECPFLGVYIPFILHHCLSIVSLCLNLYPISCIPRLFARIDNEEYSKKQEIKTDQKEDKTKKKTQNAPDPLFIPVKDVNDRFISRSSRQQDIEATERTPLLIQKTKPITPLPKVQLSIVFLIRVVEPICFQVIFPFINQMLMDVGAAKTEEEVGYAAGVVESVFSIAQLLTVFHWGALSDKIGRKPVLILVSLSLCFQ